MCSTFLNNTSRSLKKKIYIIYTQFIASFEAAVEAKGKIGSYPFKYVNYTSLYSE
jgi:hypothetical protein